MGFKHKDTEQGFKPMELNELNVQTIFSKCSAKESADSSSDWDEKKLALNKMNICYLLGQLLPVHDGAEEHEMDGSFFKRYSGAPWTNDSDCVINLLNMGGASGFCTFLKKDGRQFVRLDTELKPSLSPRDPRFADWMDTADYWEFLVKDIQYTHAKDTPYTEKQTKHLERAAEMGVIKAACLVGEEYLKRGEYAQAVPWFQKAAEQGDSLGINRYEYAQKLVEADAGNAEAQYWVGAHIPLENQDDQDEALKWLEKAAAQGHPQANFQCGIRYGLKGVTGQEKALRYFRAAANKHTSSKILANLMREKGLFRTKTISFEDVLTKFLGQWQDIPAEDRKILTDLIPLLPYQLMPVILSGVKNEMQAWRRA